MYLWRLDAQARMLRRELERERQREQPFSSAPRATVKRVSSPEHETVEQ
jgi:hypothetical protein